MVAQESLELFVMVRIHAGQPLVRILDHSEAVVAVNHFSVGAARAAQGKVLERVIN
jgi:hypothetical protein